MELNPYDLAKCTDAELENMEKSLAKEKAARKGFKDQSKA
jgi:hypothetical protein